MQIIPYLLFYLFALSPFICEAWLREEIQKVDIQQLSLEECLLPKDHPLQDELKDLFKKSHMFKSNEHLRRAGFYPCNKPQKSFMVATHPNLKKYLIKKYNDQVPQKKQIKKYLDRINAARALQKFIELNHLKSITVPQKWIYKLSKSFSNPQTGQSSYLLIVEKMDILNGGDDPNGEVAIKYRHIEYDILRELCIVLYHFRGLDSSLRNMPFTQGNQIAFIDTEHWQDKDRDFLQHIRRYLNPDLLEYSLMIYEELKDPK